MDAGTVHLSFNAGSSRVMIFDAGTGAARPTGKGTIDFEDSALVLRHSLGDDSFERPFSGDGGERLAEVMKGTPDHLLARLPSPFFASASPARSAARRWRSAAWTRAFFAHR
ncbi:hypothetical protein [Rhizobium azibense]|uniref:Uncharacterized protein n=1 Tax=Rhizobium azibense TaxID=1136135 RepID=A0A4R3RQ55_9HYPH|nr:hypothetical protein [Rhizobium azibense]TCU36797.1 hypothetical protein EV129_107369 [Rhizobium azibense]